MRSKFINADTKLQSKRIATKDSKTNFYGGGKARGDQEKFLEDAEIRSGLEGWVAFWQTKIKQNGGLGEK